MKHVMMAFGNINGVSQSRVVKKRSICGSYQLTLRWMDVLIKRIVFSWGYQLYPVYVHVIWHVQKMLDISMKSSTMYMI